MGDAVLSLVLPIYNEEEVVHELHARLQKFLGDLGMPTEVLFVDDGSRDRSLEMLRQLATQEPRYRVLSFARNFGHQAAITAGVDHADGQAVVVMDADLQDPPEVVLEMVAKWREGFDVVYGKRRSRQGETFFKLLTARWFYRIFSSMIPVKVPLDTGDFRLMSRRVVLVLRELRESHRFVRGLVAWLGFKQTAVLYDRPGRFAGETKFPLRKMVRFAIDGITSFSILPLRFATYLGIFISFLSLGTAIWALVARFAFRATVPGWTTVIVLVSLLAAVQLLMIGILGEYLGRIYEQVKLRPLYIVAERINVTSAGASVTDRDSLDRGSLLGAPRTYLRPEGQPPEAPLQRASRGKRLGEEDDVLKPDVT
jgi:polyisoprenyl-phosphate glycosyltransferase